ncbi:MAG: tripartite tricarboxylate transporter substrate binding protein [Burkholderiales bacterium]|nr:tripartite tricarboxylate transporter substrate binding protein [Burkholderiales bacterium]
MATARARLFISLAIAACFGAWLPAAHAGEVFPQSRPIRLVVGFTPGGAADTSARMVSRRMSEPLGGAGFVIENRPGAGGNVAAEIVARATPDGHTLFWGSVGPLSVSAALGVKLPYDVFRDFVPIGLAVTSCNILAARMAFKGDSLGDVLAQARARPGQINYATQGLGSTGYLAGELLRAMSGVELVQVPYKGGAQVVTSLIGGEVELAFVSVTALKGAGQGRIKPLAVTCGKRDPGVPAVPTFAESGVAGYDASFWYGLLAPRGTDAAVVVRLNAALTEALADKAVAQPLELQGLIAAASTPREFAALIRRDYEKWKQTFAGRKSAAQ